MKTNKHILQALMITALFTLNGCKDHDDDHKHGDKKPIVTFINPTEGATYNEGDTLWLRVNMKSEEDLHDYSLEVKNLTTGNTAYSYNGHSHNKELTTALSFIPRVNETSAMQFSVINKDHDGNIQQQQMVKFTVTNVSNADGPSINLLSPTSSSQFQNGSVMRIRGDFAHNSTLKEANITLRKDGSTIINYSPLVNGINTYSFDTSHKIQTTGHSDYDLVITVKDQNNNANTRTLSFHVH
ncbi:MAG: hypothetical protein EAY81_05345 [Bacteroidetes bacterium]|nr:MAG: hypothetical protein EAY81_05345 [Bacteroidota bacterium]